MNWTILFRKDLDFTEISFYQATSWHLNILIGILKKLFQPLQSKMIKWYLLKIKWYLFPSTQSLGTAWEPLNVFDLFPKEVSKQLFKLLLFPGTKESLDCQTLECFKRRFLPPLKERSNPSASLPLEEKHHAASSEAVCAQKIWDRTTYFLSPSASWKYSRYSCLSSRNNSKEFE